ncbi:MAG: hypothetical protein LBN00_10550 [Oscillospiraceae bacterium]|jgi:hypothetical protein|nr:hypothetical protein [Oscillospiraceae bacterium]
MDDKEYSNVYSIPANYTDSGKLFGGMLETRNTIETVLLVLLVGYPELAWITATAAVKVVLAVVTLLPLCVFGLMGISGDSLTQYVARIIRFGIRRRKLHLRRVGHRYAHTKTPKKYRKPKRRNT